VTELSIIIVNYKTPRLVIDCLRTVYRETTGVVFEVIVVDNASGDESEGMIGLEFPAVRWIQMGYNAGFARANNEGIRQSGGGIILVLNSDTLVEAKAVQESCCLLKASPYVACGVQLLNVDRTPQISGNFFMRGGLNYLLPLPYLGSWVKKTGEIFHVAKPNVPDATSVVEVDWINGAYLMVKRPAVEEAGLMDEDFFLYAEEAEWCGRLRKTGRLCLFGQLHVVHLQGASANETFGSEGKGYYNLYDRKGLQIMLSNFVRIRKQFGTGWFLLQLGFYWLDIPIFGIGVFLSVFGGRGKMRYSWPMWRGYCRNVGQITRKIWVIARNRPYFYKVL
jgi:GT2 family glycosyltransferase